MSQTSDGDGDGAKLSSNPSPAKPTTQQAMKKGLRFYAIIAAIVFAGVLTALEGTITGTALPSIIADLEGGDAYVWTANGYFLAM
jgi:hypothetical protein